MKRVFVMRVAAGATLAAAGLLGFSRVAAADDFSIGIRVGEPAPVPPPVVVQETTVVTYDTYVVGPRRAVYDADWRLRLALADEARAQDTLDAARHREGEIALALDEGAGDPRRLRGDLDLAQDDVFAARERLAAAHDGVVQALHDRDEALWFLYRDDLIAQRVRPEAVGFVVDLSAFGGRYPRDPEVLHRYCVRDVRYWYDRPADVYTRVVEVDRVTEITRIREVEGTHEVRRIREVETVEARYTPEYRRATADRVVVERQRFDADRLERRTAAAEGRRPRVSDVERAEAKATVINARADAHATRTEARGDARAERVEAEGDRAAARGEARADVIRARGDARAEARAARDAADASARQRAADPNAGYRGGKAQPEPKADAPVRTSVGGRATRESQHKRDSRDGNN